MQANISGIIKSSTIDGPGNRLVVFFQQCNLNCLYCHNSHTIGLCNLCGICVQACPNQSLKIDVKNKRILYNELSCTHCDNCLAVCPESSSPFYKKMTVKEIISEIIEVNDFISGLTFSGGEVMLQSEFLWHLLKSVKEHPTLSNLSILVDSNGNVDLEKWDSLLDLVDGFMIDCKAYDAEIHKSITGYSNTKILKSIQYLDSKHKLKEVRIVLLPAYNNSEIEIKKIACLLKSLSPRVNKVLIKMRKHGLRKAYAFLSEPTILEMKNAQKIFEESGVQIQLI